MNAPVQGSKDYRVQLDAFDGPLDLLLYLIRRAEVDIHDVPIADITDQYVKYLGAAERIDIEMAGEFLVMAATLMEIKARMLGAASQPMSDSSALERPADEAAEGDPRADLIKQLLDYKAYRDAAAGLETRLCDWSDRFPNAKAKLDVKAEDVADAKDWDLDDLNLIDLIQAFADICSSVNFERLGEHEVSYDDTPIELHAADILDRLRRGDGVEGGQIPIVEIFRGHSRSEMIGLFMAMLELCRQRRVMVRQSDETDEISIMLREEEETDVASKEFEEPAPGEGPTGG